MLSGQGCSSLGVGEADEVRIVGDEADERRSSKTASAWWDSHRNRISCNGAFHTGSFTLDKVEPHKKGTLKAGGTAWVQFCITTGTTEANTKLLLSRSGWVHVSS
jgi:hypothetical protein